MNTQSREYIDHEVRIQLIEKLIAKFEDRFKFIDQRFDHLESKIDSHFKWMLSSILGLGLVLTTFLGTIALHATKAT